MLYNLLGLMIGIVFLFSPTKITAQCAGGDATIQICDYPNPANQNINLFNALQGNPTPGGVWSGGLQGGAITSTTGILNAWNLHISGTFQFTYTVSGVAGCADNTSVVTVVLGPWAGTPSPNGSACNDDDNVNLFQFFVGGPPSPMQNGTWSDDSNTGALNNNFLDATASGLGTFTFTYSFPAVGTCPATSSTIFVTVHKKPEAGNPGSIWICETDDMTPYTNVDLTTLLTGQDPYGLWSETNTSGQLNGIFDTFINVQEIYQNYGPGEYTFNYTVYPDNPVCPVDVAGVKIKIDKQYDFTGAILTAGPDICEDEMAGTIFTATLQQGLQPIPDDHYTVTYTVNGANTTVVNADFTAGTLHFVIPPALLTGPGDYVIHITNIKFKDVLSACEFPIDVSDTITINPLPKINDATLNITSACLNSAAVVVLSDNDLADGAYQITYAVTGSNTVTPQTITINYVNGNATFSIPASQLPNVGTCNLAISFIKNVTTGCDNTATLSKPFTVNPFPDLSALQVTVGNACRPSNVPVILSGLPNGNLTVNYELSGANVAASQSVAVTVANGAASFILPAALIPNNGTSTIAITVVTNSTSGCSSTANKSDDFTISERPVAPVANNVSFCKTDNATIGNLLPSGTAYKWYLSNTSTAPLAATTVLVSATYYVTETNPATLCESDKTAVVVTINELQPPVLQSGGATFCGLDHPTIAQLSAAVSADNQVRWYDAPGGNLLPDAQLLTEGTTYYGYDFDAVENCQSQDALIVTVTLKNCDPVQYDFFVPDGFSPNGDGVNDVFRIPDVEFLYPGFQLEIYNRYGALLFKGNKNRPAWDGKTTEGTDVIDGTAPNGVYFFILYFNRDNKKPMQGRLYLNR